MAIVKMELQGDLHYEGEKDTYQSGGQCATPEPSTIVFLGLGALGVLGLKKYRKERKG